MYKDLQFDCGFRIDLLVNDQVVVEIKAVEVVLPIHLAQMLTYLKITGNRVHVGITAPSSVAIRRQEISTIGLLGIVQGDPQADIFAVV
jgi:hypothetical protein